VFRFCHGFCSFSSSPVICFSVVFVDVDSCPESKNCECLRRHSSSEKILHPLRILLVAHARGAKQCEYRRRRTYDVNTVAYIAPNKRRKEQDIPSGTRGCCRHLYIKRPHPRNRCAGSSIPSKRTGSSEFGTGLDIAWMVLPRQAAVAVLDRLFVDGRSSGEVGFKMTLP
jgi:hypothetical protein